MFARWFGHARWVWNWALDARRKAYVRRTETLTSVDLSRTLTRIKRAMPWLREVPSSCLMQARRDLDCAYRNRFEGRAQLPRFKSERRAAQRARVGFDARHVSKVRAWNEGRMVLPQLGSVKLRGRRLPAARPKMVAVFPGRRETLLGQLCRFGAHRAASSGDPGEYRGGRRCHPPRRAQHRGEN